MKRIVVFRHGIVINRWFMKMLERRFRKRGYEVHNKTYPSTKKLVEEHAEDLAEELVARYEDARRQGEEFQLHVVTHSMGGLLLRYALTHYDTPPLGHCVQLVPPNRGSFTARHYRKFLPYRWVYGPKAGAQLSADLPGIYGECGEPDSPKIGIIAGSARFKVIPSPLPKPNDGIVSLEEARFADWPLIELPHGHTPILVKKATFEQTAAFLETGEFLRP